MVKVLILYLALIANGWPFDFDVLVNHSNAFVHLREVLERIAYVATLSLALLLVPEGLHRHLPANHIRPLLLVLLHNDSLLFGRQDLALRVHGGLAVLYFYALLLMLPQAVWVWLIVEGQVFILKLSGLVALILKTQTAQASRLLPPILEIFANHSRFFGLNIFSRYLLLYLWLLYKVAIWSSLRCPVHGGRRKGGLIMVEGGSVLVETSYGK